MEESLTYKLIEKNPDLLDKFWVLKRAGKGTFIRAFPKTYNKMKRDEFPSNVQIQTISLCNARCIMCPYKDVKDTLPHGKMSKPLFRKIIDECVDRGVRKVVPFLMAEPLLDNDLFDHISYTKKKLPNVKIQISTNGGIMTKKKAQLLAKSEVDIITFNFQGINKESYENIMGLNFDQTIDNIQYFLSLKKENNPIIKIGTLIGVLPKNEINNFVNFWKKEGVILEIRKAHNRAGNLEDGEIKYDTQHYQKTYGCMQDRHLKWIHILFNGDVVLCCQDWKREVILGNVKEDSIHEIWNSKKFEKIRKQIISKEMAPKNFLCKKCYFAIR